MKVRLAIFSVIVIAVSFLSVNAQLNCSGGIFGCVTGITTDGTKITSMAIQGAAGTATGLILRAGGNTGSDVSTFNLTSLAGTVNAIIFSDALNSTTRIKSLGTLAFHAGNSGVSSTNQFLTIGATGNIAVGDTGPISLFSVNGPGATGYTFSVDAGTARLNGRLYTANLTTSAGLQTGVICYASTGELINDSVACLASSARFKHDINRMTDSALGIVAKMRPVTYKYNNTGFKPDHADWSERYGFIAEDVAKIDRRLVAFENDGKTPRAVTYEMYTAVLTKAIQEQQAEIDELRRELKRRQTGR